MPSFFLAFVAVALCSLGARDQLLVARLSGRSARTGSLVAVACAIAVATACLMAWAGTLIAALLPAAAKTMLVAFALAAAAFELAWPIREKAPREPTQSLVALGIVLAARQLGDAARFLIFALAVATASPQLVALGGAVGGIAAIALGFALGAELPDRWPLRAIRIILAIPIGIAAVTLGLSARGLI